MVFLSDRFKVAILVVAFASAAIAMIILHRITQFTAFTAVQIFAFLAAYSAFQLYFYLKIEAEVPKTVTKSLLKYALQVYPDAAAQLSRNNTVTPQTYASRMKTINKSNFDLMVKSPLSIFALCCASLSLVFLVWHTKPFTSRFRMLNYTEYMSIALWLAVCCIHVLLFLVIVQRQTFIYKSEIFGYGIEVLRKSMLSTIVQQASKTPPVAKAADLKVVQPQLTAFKSSIVGIDLDVASPPSILARMRSGSNRGVIVLSCIAATVFIYSVMRMLLNGNRGYVSGLCLFLGLIICYAWLYSTTQQLQLRSSMDDTELFAYEIVQK